MPYPHQPGSPYFDGAEAFEDYLDDRLITCNACNGHGIIPMRVMVYEHGCGFAHADTNEVPCAACNGTGWVDDHQ